MSRLNYSNDGSSPDSARRWSALRFTAWTILMMAMVFWATLIVPI